MTSRRTPAATSPDSGGPPGSPLRSIGADASGGAGLRGGRRALGLDVGGTKLLGVVADEGGGILAERGLPTLRDEGPEAVLGRCLELGRGLLDDVKDEARDDAEPVCAVGVGFAGLVDPAAGVVRSSVILPGWDDVPLAARLGVALGLPCALDNDATTAGLGEFHSLGAPADLDLVLLTVGTGIGGAIFSGGRLQRGASGLAGEVGHMVVDRDGDLCECGQRGCLHTVASGTALTRLAVERSRGRPDSPLHALERPSLRDVGDASRASDPLARELVEQGARALGAGVANIAQLLNPGQVSVCGGVLGLGDVYLAALRDEVRRRVFPEVADALAVVPARHGDRSGAFGAACLALEAYPDAS